MGHSTLSAPRVGYESMTEQGNDAELVRAASNGDDAAFGELVRRHAARVTRLATGMLLDETEAEDAAQEVFLKAHRSLDRFRGDAAFGTWIHRITINHCKDRLRQRALRRWISWDGLVERLGGEPAEAAGAADSATRPTEAADELARLLGGLNADQRAVLLLREQDGLSYSEIASTLRITVDAVKARLKRARAAALESSRHFEPPAGVQPTKEP
jgi:RNA polymerase sigma-70 factor (ECF subfamily)